MVERHWKGIAKPGFKENYIRYLQNTTFTKLRQLPGFVSAKILTKELYHGGTEFLIITTWESIEHIKAFSGEDYETAVVPTEVAEMMLGHEDFATHYYIVTSQA